MTNLDPASLKMLSGMKVVELKELCTQLELSIKSNLKKDEIIMAIDNHLRDEESNLAYGTLDILADGYGFLRNTSVEKDIYVSSSQIRKFKLRRGDFIFGETKVVVDDKNGALKRLLRINDSSPLIAEQRIPFEQLVPSYPEKQIILERSAKDISGRIIDLVAPIGLGQRALIISPPKAGKTTLLANIANSIVQNNSNLLVWILLVDERPEEVTDIKVNVAGVKVFSSTFDLDPKHHIKVTEEVLDEAKKEVECGKNVVILMDSLTRLARAYNIIIPSSGKLLSGGIDPASLHFPKKFFGTARNIQNGGSLTIIATVLVETGSKMDDIIFEEFKSTGNCDIYLDRTLAELRIFPAIDIQKSGTRKEELLLDRNTLKMIWEFRRYIKDFDKTTASIKLIEAISTSTSNKNLLNMYLATLENERNYEKKKSN